MTLNRLIKTIVTEKHQAIGYLRDEKYLLEKNEESGNDSDASGKAFEIHVAKHIGHIINGEKGHPDDHHAEHFSDESGDSPVESLVKQKKKLGEHVNSQIDSHARRMAHHIVNHIRKHTNSPLSAGKTKVYWTSKPNDLERLTGKKGIKGTSDIVIHDGKHYHGVSLKYSNSGTNPSLRSPGIEDLTKHLRASSDHVSSMISQHDKEVDSHVGHLVGQGSKKQKHNNFKSMIASGGQKAAAAAKALGASKAAHGKLATHFADSFNKLSHEHKTNFIRRMNDAEEQPTIKPYRASYDAKRRTSKITNPTEEFDASHAKTKHYEAESSGSTFNIYAVGHDGSRRKVCSVGIKNKSSSPYTPMCGRVSDTSSVKKK